MTTREEQEALPNHRWLARRLTPENNKQTKLGSNQVFEDSQRENNTGSTRNWPAMHPVCAKATEQLPKSIPQHNQNTRAGKAKDLGKPITTQTHHMSFRSQLQRKARLARANFKRRICALAPNSPKPFELCHVLKVGEASGNPSWRFAHHHPTQKTNVSHVTKFSTCTHTYTHLQTALPLGNGRRASILLGESSRAFSNSSLKRSRIIQERSSD